MCREDVTIALCAPSKAPALSFTCGKLHMIAQERHVCDRARGPCVCFFGTCGTIQKNVSACGIDLSAVRKVRCAECTAREDNVGDRRDAKQVIESCLLQRIAINPKDDFVAKKHSAMLQELWGGANTCPFHAQEEITRHASISSGNVQTEPSNQRPVTPKTHVESVHHSPSASRDTVDDGWTGSVAPSSGKDRASRKSSASPTGIASVDSVVGLKSSRWAPKSPEPVVEKEPAPQQKPRAPAPTPAFVPDPGNASKVRDATKKMANVKAFLSGTRMF